MRSSFGHQPTPRMLAIGVDDVELRERLVVLAPTVRFITLDELIEDINQREWEVAVLWDCDADIDLQVNVVQFGGTRTSRFLVGQRATEGLVNGPVVSTVYTIPDQGVEEIMPLAQSLAEQLVSAGRSTYLTCAHAGVVPFVTNTDNQPAAGFFRRSTSEPLEWWWLPKDVERPDRWVEGALARWRTADPDRFEPDMTDWLSDPRWQTQDERAAAARLSELESAHELAVRRYEEAREGISLERQAASALAGQNERRLLTAQADGLKDEVVAALREVGYVVQDADVVHAEKGDLLEDLRVLDPDDPDWITLVEVRGYTRGAQLRDLQRIARFVARYAAAEGRLPNASWYVVNQSIGSDPATRQIPLASNPDEVAEFADGGGLVVDTRDLFVLRERVRSGDLSAEDARARFRATGRLVLDP